MVRVEMISVHPSTDRTLQPAPHGTFRLDTLRSRVAFSVRHMTGRVHGVFTRVAGVVDYDARHPESIAARVTIQSSSVVTHSAARDARVRSPGFLDVRAFPEITFVATGARRCRRSLEVLGNLTIHGVSRHVTVTVGKVRRIATTSKAREGRGPGIAVVAKAL